MIVIIINMFIVLINVIVIIVYVHIFNFFDSVQIFREK